MAEKAKKDNKNIIIGACAAIVVVVIIVVAIVLGMNKKPTLNDAYFVSDDTKYVLTMDTADDEDELSPIKTHMIYFYSGDKVTGAKSYYEYADAEKAKAAYDAIKNSVTDAESVSIDGKYIILTADESEYEGLTAADAKEQIEFMQSLQNFDYDDEDF